MGETPLPFITFEDLSWAASVVQLVVVCSVLQVQVSPGTALFYVKNNSLQVLCLCFVLSLGLVT